MIGSAPYNIRESRDEFLNDDSSVTTNEMPSPQKSSYRVARVALKQKILNGSLNESFERYSPGSAATSEI